MASTLMVPLLSRMASASPPKPCASWTKPAKERRRVESAEGASANGEGSRRPVCRCRRNHVDRATVRLGCESRSAARARNLDVAAREAGNAIRPMAAVIPAIAATVTVPLFFIVAEASPPDADSDLHKTARYDRASCVPDPTCPSPPRARSPSRPSCRYWSARHTRCRPGEHARAEPKVEKPCMRRPRPRSG